jgi:peptidoglycan/LPS O-acetylase OafA/YrhL
MPVKFAFATVLLLSCLYAAWRGGNAGRIGALIFLTASILTIPAANQNPAWTTRMVYVWAVDLGCLIALMILAFNSRRYWPIWATGFQFASIATHGAITIYPNGPPVVYMGLESFWSIPILLVMLAGTRLDHKSGAFEKRDTHHNGPNEDA